MTKRKLLLVDDEPDIVSMVKVRLEANGYDVVTASDGKEAIDKAHKEKPDLIILDLMLPKIDGFKVCAMLKRDQRYMKIPIVMFTARAQETDEKLGKQLGADAYIMKPFEAKTLLDTIKGLLA